MATSAQQAERIRRIAVLGALAVLVFLLYSIIEPFLSALAWSVILALALWPPFRRLRGRWPKPAGLAPALMSCAITVGLLVPLILFGFLLVGEAQTMAREAELQLTGEKGNLVDVLGGVPFVGEALRNGLEAWRRDPGNLEQLLAQNRESLLSLGTRIMGNLGRNIFKIVVCVFTTYFLFRHGEQLHVQISRALELLGGERARDLAPKVRETVKAVVYGLVMTALAQAVLAAVGFSIAGVPYPLFLGAVMFVVSFIPFGPPLVWFPAAVSVFADGRIGWGIFVLIWGGAVISSLDNILRPLFIGKASRMPVLLVFMGVIGGIIAFGMVGVFVGPVVIAVALALWNDWIARHPEITATMPLTPPS